MIQTRIAKILSPIKIVLPVGAEHGVQEGMEFVIYELGDEVLDPQTGESLGRLELHKGRVKVSQVQDKLSVATTRSRVVERQRTAPFVSTASIMSELFSGKYQETVYEKLPLDQSTATAVAEPELTVRVGDLVRSVT